MTAALLPRAAVRRVVASIVVDETSRARGATVGNRAENSAAWADDRAFSVGSIDLDSLETVHAAAALHEMFGYDAVEPDSPHRLHNTVGQWLDRIAELQSNADASLTVMTSGSTGRPKPCVHAICHLMTEAAYFGVLLPSVKRVIALVPAHHIYGLIWTALLPAELGIPVIDASAASLPQLCEGDLIVAVPEQWQAMLRSRRPWPPGIRGVSAGAPLEDALAADLLDAGLQHLHDIYGASETGGIAHREVPNAAYVLLPRWRFALPIDAEAPVLIDRQGRELPLPDRIAIEADQSFIILGRRDGAVQVGGVNVWPEQVATVLLTCPGVAEISVRLGDQRRLKAFVVPTTHTDEAELLERLRRHAQRLPRSEQRPTSYSFGTSLPRNSLGKVQDW